MENKKKTWKWRFLFLVFGIVIITMAGLLYLQYPTVFNKENLQREIINSLTSNAYSEEECLSFGNETNSTHTTYFFNDREITIEKSVDDTINIDCFNGTYVWLSYLSSDSKLFKLPVERYIDYHNGTETLDWSGTININKGTLNNLDSIDIENYAYKIGTTKKVIKKKGYDELIKETPVNEKTKKKGQIYSKNKNIEWKNFTIDNITLEIHNIEEKDYGIDVYARAWNNITGEQYGFGKDGSVDIERFQYVNPPIIVPDKKGKVKRTYYNELTDENETQYFSEDLTKVLPEILKQTVLQVGKISSNIINKKIGKSTLTAYPNSGTTTAPVDGYGYRGSNPSTWSGIRNGAQTAHSNTATYTYLWVRDSTTTDMWNDFYRHFAGFNTSSIGGNNINSAILSYYCGDGSNHQADSMVVGQFYPDSQTNPSDGYSISNYGSVEFGRMDEADISSGYMAITLNSSGVASINKSGNSWFSWRVGYDFDDNEPSWISGYYRSVGRYYAADYSGTTRDPKLVVQHSFSPTITTPYEYYFDATEDYALTSAGSDDYISFQTFTVGTVGLAQDFIIKNISATWYTDGTPGQFNVSIYAVDGSGYPTGSQLSWGTYNGNLLSDIPNEWVTVNMTEYTLVNNTKYAIVVESPSGAIFDSVLWKTDDTGTYTGGNAGESDDGGSSWNTFSNAYDADFEIGGITATDSTPPTYSNIGHNNTINATITKFYSLWNDNSALHSAGGYIFSTNNTGIWINDSWTAFTTTPQWANITKILNETVGNNICYYYWANDTAGNINSTTQQCLTVTTPSIPSNCWSLNGNQLYIPNGCEYYSEEGLLV